MSQSAGMDAIHGVQRGWANVQASLRRALQMQQVTEGIQHQRDGVCVGQIDCRFFNIASLLDGLQTLCIGEEPFVYGLPATHSLVTMG